jgi:4-hydroxy-2-oxoheptanedioate aldolase
VITGLKARIARKETLCGIFVMVPSPAVVEMCGYNGFDYVILDAEHGAAGTETLEHQLRAADASGIPAIVRVGNRAPDQILHALDAGACGILVPHVTNAEDTDAIVRAAHFPPRGIRGLATTSRAGRHGLMNAADYIRTANDETVVIVQIEDRPALANVAAIARTPGLDAVFVGPADLATSFGYPGQPGHPEVVAAIDRIRHDVEGAEKPALANFARTESDAASLVKQGFHVVCLSTTAIFTRRLADLIASLKQ